MEEMTKKKVDKRQPPVSKVSKKQEEGAQKNDELGQQHDTHKLIILFLMNGRRQYNTVTMLLLLFVRRFTSGNRSSKECERL